MMRRDRRPSIPEPRGRQETTDARPDTAPARIAIVGVVAERIFGHGWWLVIYLGCGVVGQFFGYLGERPDAGASVAAARGGVGLVAATGSR